jgi:hypothetical protein
MATVVGAFDLRLNARVSSIHYSSRGEMQFVVAIGAKSFSKMTLT